jgi:hypothetical protein
MTSQPTGPAESVPSSPSAPAASQGAHEPAPSSAPPVRPACAGPACAGPASAGPASSDGHAQSCRRCPALLRAAELSQEAIRLPGRQLRVAPGVLRTVRNLPACPRGGWWRHGERQVRRPCHQPHRAGSGTGADGGRHHPVHGRCFRCASQPGGQPRVRDARQLPVEAGPCLHRRPGGRRGAGHAAAVGAGRQARQCRAHAARPWHLDRHRNDLGGGTDYRTGQRHPRHCVRRAAGRLVRRLRGGQLYRARRALGITGQWRLDESHPVARPRARAR